MNEVVRYLTDNEYQCVKYNESLSKYTSFKVGGIAAVLVTPESKQKIIDLITFLNQNHFKYKVFGNGSNILPSDNYYKGVIIKTNKALDYLKVNDTKITVGSGYSLVKLAYHMIDYELTGLEFIGGIPGSIGGAIYMNAGAYNKEISDDLECVTLIDDQGKLQVLTKDDLKFSYRESILQKCKASLIIDATFKLEIGHKTDIITLLRKRKERRRETQPLAYPSGGSTFRNPQSHHAYQLIDQVGLRGFQMGGAKISEKHCNFIINYNHATSQDIKELMDYIVEMVYNKSKIQLIPEIEFFNW